MLDRLPIDDMLIDSTPSSWQTADTCPALGFAMTLIGLALGEPFGWAGQQDGRLVNSIVPTPGHENEQTGASSSVLLSPHTEDAFHPDRAHLIMLGCMRNHESIGTTLASVRDVLAGGYLSPDEIAHLRQPECPILPDDSYVGGDESQAPAPVGTLWQRDDGACLRYDPAYTPDSTGRPTWARAYAKLEAGLASVSQLVALEPGQVLILDNDVAVHGRVPFTARFDGTDRWLLRLNIRLADRDRPAAESFEPGFGQVVVRPYSEVLV
ncbi:Enduracididine beta-hydroxylase [Gordonia insulae]|uniref:Enduracididine beta-hydroxylase n=1 Tax=Gordonia insulae TaxID=2420509 RepID=A0A3G8JNN9_9ACTN|nr:Enduracididine beta-hydroxylase [Gordonia insulae]